MSLRNSKPYWNCNTWRFNQKISVPNYQKLKTKVKESIDQNNSVYELLTPGMGELKQEQWSRVERE